MQYKGKHLTADMYGCSFDALNDLDFIKEAIFTAVKEANMTLLELSHHEFGGAQGLTAMALLSESHLSIHTNPSLGYAAIDVFTLSQTSDPNRAVLVLKKLLKPDKIKTTQITRGDFRLQKDMKPRAKVSTTPLRRVKSTGAKVLNFLGRKAR
ncbi:adenosylmethionine decarboxylase [Selenomonadales bacterium OttesenSCG-928-I06]|nr:adenosylmethionine decarboxylase [Selenomonadales bacterium OttesenSCG-928-I06]